MEPAALIPTLWPLVPHSGGSHDQLWDLTVRGLAQLPQSIERLVSVKAEPVLFDNWDYPPDVAVKLKAFLDAYGSDKASGHTYHKFYSSILNDDTSTLFEIGLGTNNVDVASHMGAGGRPGASLRAFRDFLPNARIFGADVDERILFEEERIKTRHVDQLDFGSLLSLKEWLPPVDVFIDDGLHSFVANINSLAAGLTMTKPGGWVVIEDVMGVTIPMWQAVIALLPAHQAHILLSGHPWGNIVAFQVDRGNS